jgi:RHS repeat-associated protein
MWSRRSPIFGLVARVLIAALVLGSLPAPAAASARLDPLRGSIHADGIGSIRRLTDESANITDGYTYSAFGELLAHTGSDPQPYAFTGEPLDPISGFQYNRARWMDPRTGRFTGVDPFVGDAQAPRSLHRYLYAGADPVVRLDPTGRFELSLAGFTVSMGMNQVIKGISSIVAGAVFGAIDGGIRAELSGQDWQAAALKGARTGALLGPLARLKWAQPFLMSAGIALAGMATFEAYQADNMGLALYNGILFVGGAAGVMTSFLSREISGNVLVYRSVNMRTGEVQYVGITDSFARRAAEHLASKGIAIQEVKNLGSLTRYDARAVEQALIQYYGLGRNGGSLLNRINSIAPTDPDYAGALLRGYTLLQRAGYF